jgi:hypothetical protein
MTNRFANYFALGFIRADGSVQVEYSTHDYSIRKWFKREYVEAYIAQLKVWAPKTEWKVLTYPEAVELF